MASPQRKVARSRPVRLGPQDVVVARRADGTIDLRSPHALGPYPTKLTERLEYWAAQAPDRVFMAERPLPNPPPFPLPNSLAGEGREGAQAGEGKEGGWRTITYAQTLARVRRIAQGLLERDLSPERPIAILSGNDLEHALLGLAAIHVGIPYAPISPAYSLISSDHARLRHIVGRLTPGLVFAADGGAFTRALAAAVPPGAEIVTTRGGGTPFAALSAEPTAAVDAAHAAVGPDTVAKILFTSGSTGLPKGVINTQRMWCANQEMIRTALAFFQDEPPVLVDWAPWHHTAGGNHDVGLTLYNGGTLYIDDGKPLPGDIEKTVRNLREVAPTWYFTVPKGYEALLPYLRGDAALCRNFFSRLRMLWFAGAALGQGVFDEMKELAYRTTGEDILFLTGFGATETAPFALSRTWDADNVTNMGLPAVGMDLKLVPAEGKLEARVRGPNVTPGYWREPKLTAEAFDQEGFYRLGDAFRFADPADPRRGLLFDGRIAEDFKLATGTWVSVGPLRAQVLAHCAPYARDVVVAGADRNDLAALIFPDVEACRTLPDIAAMFRARLTDLARASTGSSNRIVRAILLDAPPSLDRGELTDKGSISQRMVLQHRAALVQELYATPQSARVIAIE
jgi:feruloyl-CoA synthase